MNAFAAVLMLAGSLVAAFEARADEPKAERLALPEGTACVSKMWAGDVHSGHDVRVVLLETGWEHLGHELYVQWLDHERDGDVVRASLRVSESMYPGSCPLLERLSDGGVRIVIQTRVPGRERGTDTIERAFIARAPGVVESVPERLISSSIDDAVP
jgi:hypothetical protein